MALLAVDHPRAAMPAEIVEGPHHAVIATHDNGALAQHVESQPVAGLGNIADMACHLPMGEEQLVALEFEHGGRMIGPGGQATTVPVIGHGDCLVGQFSHACVSISLSTHLWKR